MRRVTIWAVVGVGILAALRKVRRGGTERSQTLAQRMSAKCEQMLGSMPVSFPPNRIIADLETVKIQTARILEILNEERMQPSIRTEVATAAEANG